MIKIEVSFKHSCILNTTCFEATKWGGVSESPYKKVGPVSVLLKNPAKCLWRGSPTVGQTSSSVRLHIYVPSHI